MTSEQLLALESLSREHPDRVVRLTGEVQIDGAPTETLELLIFRGFSSCITHPTAFDPDQSVLPEGAAITAATLLQGPLNPTAERVIRGPLPPEQLLDASLWR